MQIDVRSIQFSLTDSIVQHTQDRLAAALDRHENRINSVMVKLKDVNGPKGGVDKICDIVVKFDGRGLVAIKESHYDIYRAINSAAARVKNSVGRRIGRTKNKRG